MNLDSFPNSAESINEMVENDLSDIDSPLLLKKIRRCLHYPKCHKLHWEYGENELFPAWIIADLGERDVAVAYCKYGHGALGFPWGLIFKSENYFGMSDGWYRSLIELFDEWFWQPVQ